MKFFKLKIAIFITIYFSFDILYSNTSNANPPVLDIKKLLEEKIREAESTNKPDIESLGLDNVDKKNPTQDIINSSLNQINNSNKSEIQKSSNSSQQETPNLNLNNKTKFSRTDFSKSIHKKSNKKISKKLVTKISNKNSKNNAHNKTSLRIKLEEKEAQINQKKIVQEKEKKYQNLRSLYLSDLIESEDNIDEDFREYDKVLPQKKSLAPYAVDELPPLPILNRSRSLDNYHIPFVYTPKEYIDIMFSAISMGSISYFNEAFKYVLNPNITNEQGDTILTYSIFLKKYAVMASVLAKGADPNLPNQLGHMPISIAIELNDFVAFYMLAKNNADLKYRDIYGRSYLMHASRLGFLPVVDLLIKSGVDINEMDNDGFTALSIAYRHKQELIVQYLLKNGAKTWVEKPYNPEFKSFIKNLNDRWK